VAVGSFYNHFTSKDELFAVAAAAAIDEFETYMSRRTSGIEDPVEKFCANTRVFGRMAETHPRHARVLAQTAPAVVGRPRGYSPGSFAYVQRLVTAGRIRPEGAEMTLLAAFAGFERLVVIRLGDPTFGPEHVDELAALTLMWFGVPEEEARAIAARPLPPDPDA
jgi:AcrR family transcriptional regulator